MKINYENLPRFLVPLFLAASLTVALMSLLDLSRAIAVIISLFVVVQLQKYQIIWMPSDFLNSLFVILVGGPTFFDCRPHFDLPVATNKFVSVIAEVLRSWANFLYSYRCCCCEVTKNWIIFAVNFRRKKFTATSQKESIMLCLWWASAGWDSSWDMEWKLQMLEEYITGNKRTMDREKIQRMGLNGVLFFAEQSECKLRCRTHEDGKIYESHRLIRHYNVLCHSLFLS